MQIVYKNVDELIPYVNNPRINDHAVEAVAASIEEFGFKVPIIIDKDNEIVAGHTRIKAAKMLGMEEVPTIIANDLTDEQVKAFRIADNKTAELAEWDYEILMAELDLLEDIDMEQFGFEDLADKLEPTAEEDGYELEVPDEPRAKLGEVYQLGRHRLMCGDSTKKEDIDILMNGIKADISFTSPPYNIGTSITEDRGSKYLDKDIDNKTDDEYLNFLISYTENALQHSCYTFVNIQSLSGNKIALIEYLFNMQDKYADTIIWDKGNTQPAMAENVLNSSFEYIHIFSEKANRSIGTKKFRGTLSNIIQIGKQTNNEFSNIHNATFSIEFASYFIRNFSTKTVVDLFGGTGTTLIACEQLDRTCYMMELDPRYIDVIIDRWEKLTGQTAELLS